MGGYEGEKAGTSRPRRNGSDRSPPFVILKGKRAEQEITEGTENQQFRENVQLTMRVRRKLSFLVVISSPSVLSVALRPPAVAPSVLHVRDFIRPIALPRGGPPRRCAAPVASRQHVRLTQAYDSAPARVFAIDLPFTQALSRWRSVKFHSCLKALQPSKRVKNRAV